tara:strand:- start:25608 stop:26543 length:936 start_codon:yes stop_codon:yes gene_type:complete
MNSKTQKLHNRKYIKTFTILFAIGLNILISLLMGYWSYSWLPVQASKAAEYVDNLFAFETTIGTFIFLGCTGTMAWILIFNRAPKYDESNGEPLEGNLNLEIIWTIIPLILVLAISTYSTKINYKLNNLGSKIKFDIGQDIPVLQEKKTFEYGPIDVVSRQWNWEFIYPNGIHSSELHLPLNKRTNFRLITEDVIHSFYVPAFRLKQDIIPGSVITYSLTPTREGVFRLRDAMFSGAYFSQNQTNVIVESEDGFKKWIDETVKKETQDGLNPAGLLYDKRLKNGNRGWATIEPAPAPKVQDKGLEERPHDG